ncbi:MAG: hypothetical protein IT186_20620 [Acidobacteria bacterium]|nr:hypothetical protein [Acidobacteriota bacterium]
MEYLLDGLQPIPGEERVLEALGGELISPDERNESLRLLALRLDACVYMRSQLLRDSDTTSMAHSLELRVPLVDDEVARFALSCPSEFIQPGKASSGSPGAVVGSKGLLIEALRDFLPQGIEKRPKEGFSLAFDEWMRGALFDIAMDTTAPQSVSRRGWLNGAAVAEVRREFERKTPGAAYPKLWSLMILELWAQGTLDDRFEGADLSVA